MGVEYREVPGTSEVTVYDGPELVQVCGSDDDGDSRMYAVVAENHSDGIVVTGSPAEVFGWLNRAWNTLHARLIADGVSPDLIPARLPLLPAVGCDECGAKPGEVCKPGLNCRSTWL